MTTEKNLDSNAESIVDKADELLFEIIKEEYGAEIPNYLLNQFRNSRTSAGRKPVPNIPPVTLPETFIPETFLEFLTETSEKDRKTLTVLASRNSQIAIVEPDVLPTCPTDCFEIKNLPVDLLYKTPFGTATLIHCVPFLEKTLASSNPTGTELTALDLLRKSLGVLKIHFLLVSQDEFKRLQSKRRSNGKTHPTTFEEIEAQENPDMNLVITSLESLALLQKNSQETQTKLETWDFEKIEEILKEVKKRRPKEGASNKTEWTNLTGEFPYLNLENSPIQEKLIAIFPAQAQKQFECFPLHQEARLITIACHQLPQVQDRSEMIAGLAIRCKIHFVLASHAQVMGLINKALSTKVNLQHIAEEIDHEDNSEDSSGEQIDIEALIKGNKDDETTVIQLLQALIVQAVQDKATDIHVASAPENLSIRFRVDGILLPYPHLLPRGLDKPLITRIKIVSNINTQKTGMPEDGKFSTKIGGLEYEIRVTTCPTVHGEKAVLRIQPKSSHIPTLESLGFQGIEKQVVIKAIDADHGLLIICGPTGAGKCLGPNTKVIKYDGRLELAKNIKTGDLLMGPDSKPRKVLGTTTGKGPLYQITPIKGEPWICNDVHVMTLKHTAPNMEKHSVFPTKRKRNEGMYQAFGHIPKNKGKERLNNIHPEIIDVPLNEFISRTSPKKQISQHWKLFRTGVEFPTPQIIKEIPDEMFYYAGLWIGDGTSNCNEITNEDKEIKTWIENFAKENNHRFLNEKNKQSPNILTLASKPPKKELDIKYHQEYPFIYHLKNGKMKICLRTLLACCRKNPSGKYRPTLRGSQGPKIIPQWMKTATTSQKKQLLAGIHDSDGSLNHNGFDITLKEKELLEGIIFISRNLGLWANPPKERSIKGKTYWRTYITGETKIIPTKIQRKTAKTRIQTKDASKTGWKADPIGKGNYAGFQVDGDGRFLLGDFTVTHNSTTLYAAIGLIDRVQWNVITGEQPVEIKIPGCEQTPITNQLTFGRFITASLRQDPDYIMIGETRDKETTEELVRASITGHIVLTTLHTNSAPSAPSRLIDLGAKPYLLADALSGVCAQRLLRRLCTNCLQQVPLPSMKKLLQLGIREEWMLGAEVIGQPVGCKMCRSTGYAGRVAVIEGYTISRAIQEIIVNKDANPRAIQAVMEEQGSKSLYQHAVENVAKGVCSLSDALSINNLD